VINHDRAAVNGVQLHYLTGGSGNDAVAFARDNRLSAGAPLRIPVLALGAQLSDDRFVRDRTVCPLGFAQGSMAGSRRRVKP
jgi:hypothetical protein